MQKKDIPSWKECVRNLGKSRVPFFFMVDYEISQPVCYPLHELPANIHFCFHAVSNTGKNISITPQLCSIDEYKAGFDIIQEHLRQGDSYLVNYTLEVPVVCDCTLGEIYDAANAPYKLLVDNQFVAFSPEAFVKIQEDGRISTFPMKGTIQASVGAEERLMSSAKEAAEHATVVDLLRNDLSRVASDVTVDRYRYASETKTTGGSLLHASSCISGYLGVKWNEHIADILLGMLPAGSVTGAPKPRTLEVIRKAETHKRGFYTGVFGVFDGNALDSAVTIRYIQERNGQKFFKSGGGITAKSSILDEYNEVKQKIYVPIG